MIEHKMPLNYYLKNILEDFFWGHAGRSVVHYVSGRVRLKPKM